MQLWLRSSSRQTRTSSTADRQFPPSTFFMAKGVAKSFRKHLSSFINFYVAMENGIQADEKAIRTLIKEYLPSIQSGERERETLRIALIALQINIDKEHLARII